MGPIIHSLCSAFSTPTPNDPPSPFRFFFFVSHQYHLARPRDTPLRDHAQLRSTPPTHNGARTSQRVGKQPPGEASWHRLCHLLHHRHLHHHPRKDLPRR